MKIVVCVKQVPDTWAEKKLSPTDQTLDRDSADSVMNELDEYAVEEALRIKEANGGPEATPVTILTMGPEKAGETIRKALLEEFKYENEMQVPRIDKIVLNMGVGEATADSKKPSVAAQDLALIAGQKAVVTHARTSIAGFKVRENMPIGAKVTLRKERMYEFLDRLVNIALPRVRDFRGLNPKSFDGRGNYSLGIKEHIVFPEVNYDKVDQIWGMDIVVCTTAKTDDEARALLKAFNFPFRQ